MVTPTHPVEPSDVRTEEDEIVRRQGVSWEEYLLILRRRGDRSAPRIAYLEGELEIMSPALEHESIKSRIGCLVEVWCLENGIEFDVYGSWTLKRKAVARGAEPDECYVFGEVRKPRRPHLAIEIVWTSGRLDKLEIYRKLGVREVWYWREGRLTPYALRGDRYEEIGASEVLPGIDLEQLVRFLDRPTASRAIRDYRAALRL